MRANPAATIDDLLDAASSRAPWFPEDTKSGARFERVTIEGEGFILKYQDIRDDWIMRATGDTGERYVRLWTSGLLDRMPAVIDHAVVAASVDDGVGRILLRDVGPQLLEPGAPFSPGLHAQFIDHMAALHATFWGWKDDVGLTTLRQRYLAFSPDVARAEAAMGSGAIVPPFMAKGWPLLAGAAPELASVVMPLLGEPAPLIDAISALPHTLVHGDWKAANIGSHADGRSVLLDFGELPGEASPLADLAWYLALNADLLPESKDATIERYRAALEANGIGTTDWWERAVCLEMLATMVQFGWEKALGGASPELAWWETKAVAGASLL